MFTIFNQLPTELRLTVWALASEEPRTLDIWTYHQCGEKDDEKFQLQIYTCGATNKFPPAVLLACSEARKEGLRHYTIEFETVSTTTTTGASYKNDATFYINYACDNLVPRGDWNPVAFWNFMKRTQGKMRFIALDVSGEFWNENVEKCIETHSAFPLFMGVKDIILYTQYLSLLGEPSGRIGSFVEMKKTGRHLANSKTLLSTYLDILRKRANQGAVGRASKVCVTIMKQISKDPFVG